MSVFSYMGVGLVLLTEDLTKVQKNYDISKNFLIIYYFYLFSKTYCVNGTNVLSLCIQIKNKTI
jgi:hypothetical protein